MAQKMKESPAEGDQTTIDAGKTQQQPGSPKSRLAMLKRSSAKKSTASQDPFRFQGQGVQFKGKLIGIRDVDGARGDAMCAEAMRQAKAAIKAAGSHKQRIILYINIEGIKIVDEKSQATLYNFPVSRISFIARDTTDARAFGFVYGESAGNYKFYGIKTAQTADHAVLSIRDMFQIVFEMKKKQIQQVKQKAEEGENSGPQEGVRSEEGVLVADLLDLETEVQNIQQGLNQLANIPVVPGDEWPGENQQPAAGAFVDPFGAQPFVHTPTVQLPPPQQYSPPQNGRPADPFGDSFSAPPQTQTFTTPSMHVAPQASVFHTPPSAYTSPMQPPMGYPQQAQWTPQTHIAPPCAFPQPHSTPAFSTTNPFADMASSSDPFDTAQFRGQLTNGGIGPVQAQHQTHTVNWGTNENTAPSGMHHAHSFAAFESQSQMQRKASAEWDAPRKVTSLEDAFTKLVDMESLVGGKPNEAKKNPFEHIINPPKVPLNSLGPAPAIPQRPVAAAFPAPAATNDPFSDAFFN